MKTIKQKFIIDESGSMLNQWDTVISGFNEQLDTMKVEESTTEVRYLVSLTKFSYQSTVVYKDIPLAEVPRLTKQTYTPGGGTALLDAIGNTIDTAAPGETDVMITIMTDGEENSSREWKRSSIKTLIDLRQNENKWGFVYLGANQDAWQEAAQYGINNALNYTVANTGAAMKSMSAVRSCYVSSALEGTYATSNLCSTVNTEDLVK